LEKQFGLLLEAEDRQCFPVCADVRSEHF